MKIDKLFVLSYGEVAYPTGMLRTNGIYQSEVVGRRLISWTKNRPVSVISPTNWGPESETADIICSEILHETRYITRKYVYMMNGTKIDNVFHTILDVVYDCRDDQDDIVILIASAAKINRLARYFCKENKIPFSSTKDIGACCGYTIDCITKECTSIDWSR